MKNPDDNNLPDDLQPDFNIVIQSLLLRRGRITQSDKTRAEELFSNAMEVMDNDEKLAFKLLAEALDLDPTHVSAWWEFAQFHDLGSHEYIRVLRKLIAIEETNLGKKIFQEDRGHFWGLWETRTYMRIRQELAKQLMDAADFEESIAEHQALLELNPNDNQGSRYGLLSLYLLTNRLDEADQLFKEYDERDFSSVFAWGYLLSCLLKKKLPQAKSALQRAQKQNPHFLGYLLADAPPPDDSPPFYAPGSPEEAILAWELLAPAWFYHPEALNWLRNQTQKPKQK